MRAAALVSATLAEVGARPLAFDLNLDRLASTAYFAVLAEVGIGGSPPPVNSSEPCRMSCLGGIRFLRLICTLNALTGLPSLHPQVLDRLLDFLHVWHLL